MGKRSRLTSLPVGGAGSDRYRPSRHGRARGPAQAQAPAAEGSTPVARGGGGGALRSVRVVQHAGVERAAGPGLGREGPQPPGEGAPHQPLPPRRPRAEDRPKAAQQPGQAAPPGAARPSLHPGRETGEAPGLNRGPDFKCLPQSKCCSS